MGADKQSSAPTSSNILSILGIAFTAYAIFAFVSARDLEVNGLRAPGTVIALVANDVTSDSADYAPRVRWTDKDALVREFTGKVASDPPAYAQGQPVTVLYEADNPDGSTAIDAPGQAYLPVFLFGAMGLVFAFLGLGKVLPWFAGRSKQDET